jgi:hypothetical protein
MLPGTSYSEYHSLSAVEDGTGTRTVQVLKQGHYNTVIRGYATMGPQFHHRSPEAGVSSQHCILTIMYPTCDDTSLDLMERNKWICSSAIT